MASFNVFLFFYAVLMVFIYAQDAQDFQSVPQRSSLRMVGYLEDWKALPPITTLRHYSHVMYAFISAKDSSCKLEPPSQATVDYIHKSGALVLGSLGGAAMGQNSSGFWSDCTVDSLVSQLTAMVQNYNLDGIDIDYEVSPPVASFVIGLHNGLRSALPAGIILTHTPENSLMGQSQAYWNILQQCNDVDFISVQYYNADPAPTSDAEGSVDHYNRIINLLFNHNASKVVFGFCIEACPGYPGYPNNTNMDGPSAAAFVKKYLIGYGPIFGGVMNYAINQGDADGLWSATVLAAFPGGAPVPPPSPTPAPSPPSPTPAPTPTPPPAPPAPGDNFCGTSWADANTNCWTAHKCVSSDSECPSGLHCYNGITCVKNFCGISWSDASANCHTAARCISLDSECPSGQHCYTGVTCT